MSGKWLSRRKTPDGFHQLFKLDGTRYAIGHRVETRSEAEAQVVAQILHGRFDVTTSPDTYDTTGTTWVVLAKHYGTPEGRDGEKTLAVARKAINQAIAAAGVTGKYLGFERHEIGPPESTRRHRQDDDDDGPMGLPLPIRS
jgi:hypothetical protein